MKIVPNLHIKEKSESVTLKWASKYPSL